MNTSLRTPDAHDLSVLQEPGTTPMFFADSCALDQAGVELRIGGIVVAGLFEPLTEFENARAITCDVHPSRPDDRTVPDKDEAWEQTLLQFDTPEERAAVYTEDELEYEAWAALEALAILKERQEAAVAAKTFGSGSWAPEPICSPTNATQSVLNPFAPLIAKLSDEQIATYADTHVPMPRFLEDVGIMSHEEVAAHFNDYVSGVAA